MFGGVVRANERQEAVWRRATFVTRCGCGSCRPRCPGHAIEPVQREVVELWRPCGVDIVWEEEWTEGDPRPKPDLFVYFVNRELDGRARTGCDRGGVDSFVEGTPRELINVSVGAARGRLLNETPWLDERPVRMAPISIQDRLIGTMIGRALAHEIGHYLLASSKLTPMKV